MAKKKEEPKIVLERVYNVPLRKEFLKAPRYKRAKKAVTALKQFLVRHMKSDKIKIGNEFRPTTTIANKSVIQHCLEKLRENGFKNIFIIARQNLLTKIFNIINALAFQIAWKIFIFRIWAFFRNSWIEILELPEISRA